jgi:DNA-binding transcriptional MerR regulator
MDPMPSPPSRDAAGLPIGRAAAMLGTTVKALRTYHARGLVAEPERDASGYRRYDPATLVRLARVRRLRGLGLSLEAIGPLLRGGDGGAALRAELRRLDAELAEEARRLRRAGR